MILAFDTSTRNIIVALASDAGVLLGSFQAEATTAERGIHDARLALETERLLQQAGADAGDITRIGLVIGPGSFTGLRIGLAFAKGLAYATGASIVPLTHHEVLLRISGPGAGHIITAGYQPRTVYYASADSPRSIRLIGFDELVEISRTGVLAAHELLRGTLGENATYLETTAEGLVALTRDSTVAASGDELDALEPLYLTDFSPGKTTAL